MRPARRVTEAAARPRRAVGPLGLAGLFCAVWALALQVSLPLATTLGAQLSAGGNPAVYDLIPALTGRIHSGHGSAGGDHSLPVQADVTALLTKTETASLHTADIAVGAPYQAATVAGWPRRPHFLSVRLALDHAHLSRAPPFVQAIRQTV